MRRLANYLRDLIPSRSLAAETRQRLRRRVRLQIEPLEDRSLLSANASATVAGIAFSDVNHNGALDAGEPGLPGVPVNLTGTTAAGATVNLLATTDAGGAYAFQNVLRGTYQLTVGPSLGNLSGAGVSGGFDTIPTFTVQGGTDIAENAPFSGLDPAFLSLRMVLTTTTPATFQFSPPGTNALLQANYRANNAPVVGTPIADVSVNRNAPDKIIDLAANFTDPDMRDTTIVQLNTSMGNLNIQLFDQKAPQTVANFLDYVNSGAYNNSIFHRLVSGFVLQGGGFTFNAANPSLTAIPTNPSVANEFGTSNTLGTVAMAKLGGDPNSATDQFFFNLGDNSSNLDNQNGGFTVFGQVGSAGDQAVVNLLASLPAKDVSNGDPSSPFNQVPLNNYNGTNFPTDATASNFDLINSATVINQDEKLTYSVVGNSNPNLVTATVNNERLTLHYTPGATGAAAITVRATDRYGVTVDDTFNVAVDNHAPTATVGLSPSSPLANSTLTATATTSDPDGDPVNLTYVWKANGNVVQTTANTSNKTDTLNLSTVPGLTQGSQITVEVTPSDGVATGTTASASTTVVTAAPTASVSLSPGSPSTQDTVTAFVTASDPQGLPLTLTYLWQLNGNTVKTTSNTSSLTDSVDLSTLSGVQSSDKLSVAVTPSNGSVTGQTATTFVQIV